MNKYKMEIFALIVTNSVMFYYILHMSTWVTPVIDSFIFLGLLIITLSGWFYIGCRMGIDKGRQHERAWFEMMKREQEVQLKRNKQA